MKADLQVFRKCQWGGERWMNQFGNVIFATVNNATLILTAHFQVGRSLVLSNAAPCCANVLTGV